MTAGERNSYLAIAELVDRYSIDAVQAGLQAVLDERGAPCQSLSVGAIKILFETAQQALLQRAAGTIDQGDREALQDAANYCTTAIECLQDVTEDGLRQIAITTEGG
jgi:hypothetical protein